MSSTQDQMRLIYTMRSRGVSDRDVLNAIESIDRAKFVPDSFQDKAYEDIPLPIAAGQTISQPSIVGMMSQALEIEPRHKVLEVGCGSGYQAAVLARLARRVYSIERHQRLAQSAKALLAEIKILNVIVITGDGSHGLPEQAPFDRIIVTAAAEDIPSPLLAQLRIGGKMILPVGPSDMLQTLIRATRTDEGYEYEELQDVRFVPLLEGVVKA